MFPEFVVYGFSFLFADRGAIETLGAGRGYDAGGTGGGWLHTPASRHVAILGSSQPAPGSAGYPVHPGTYRKGTKKNHLYINIPVIFLERMVKILTFPDNIFSMSAKVNNIFDSCNYSCEKSTFKSNER